jgi:2-oxoglutarate ferredoxin oxidoreductase subunit gamma
MRRPGGRFEVILAGTGGQGLILAGILLAEAAIHEGLNALQTQSYGIASRGGLSAAEVILDTQEIIFQQVERPDLIVALTEEALVAYAPRAAEETPVLYDDALAEPRPQPRFRGFSFTRTAGALGALESVNILTLGTLAGVTGAVAVESLAQAVRERFKGPALERNLKALAAGCELAAAPPAGGAPFGGEGRRG